MAKSKILVVEDEIIIAMEIEDRLDSLGYEVVDMVSSGAEAIQAAVEMPPDLVLIDIMLKGSMDGIEVASQMQARFHIPVIYLTAYADENTLQRAKTSRPFGYLVKPFEKRELQIAIEIALYKHQMESKLRENEQWRTTILNSIGDALIATDRQGYITFMNPVAEQLTGWTEQESLGQPLPQVFNIVNDKTITLSWNSLTRELKDELVGWPDHTLLIAKDGAKRAIDENVAPIKDENGQLIGRVFVFRDVSQRKKIEQALDRYRDHLEELVKERTSELLEANQQLNKEISTRIRVEQALEAERTTLAQRVAERTIDLNKDMAGSLAHQAGRLAH